MSQRHASSSRSSPPSSFPFPSPTSPSSPSSPLADPTARTFRPSPSIVYTDSDPDENFPPSISQRYPQPQPRPVSRSPRSQAHGQRSPRSPLGYASGSGAGRTIDMRASSRASRSGDEGMSNTNAKARETSYGSSQYTSQASPKTIYGQRSISETVPYSTASRSDRRSPHAKEGNSEVDKKDAQIPYDTLILPNQSETRVLKQKRSFERTKAWAAGLDLNEMVDSEGAGSLTSDDASHGSESIPTPRTPRSPSPASDRAVLPTIIAPDPLPNHSPPRILSIDELVRMHSAGISQPMAAAKDKARKELGMGPSPVAPRVDLPLQSPKSIIVPLEHDESDDDDGEGGMLRPPVTPTARAASASAVSLVTPRQQTFRTSSAPGTIPTTPKSPTSAREPLSPRSGMSARSGDSLPVPSPIPIPEAPSDAGHELALHLRSEQLNKFFVFPRPFPHHPLRVSYAEVGKADGYPVFFFLGLGCVRYLVALYDEFAQAFGLRVICVDRWGYGKTDQVEQIDRGLVEWSTVMGQVCKELKIEKCQIVAHSCGAPYALAMARRWPEMVRGKVHLLAPWVGQEHENVSKWLKWVPGAVIKTATRADHRLHSLFIGKAPKLGFKPVAFDKSSIAAAKAAKATAQPGADNDKDDSESLRSRASSKGRFKRPSKANMREPAMVASASGSSTGSNGTKLPTGLGFMQRTGFMRAPSSIYGSIGAASAVSLPMRNPDVGGEDGSDPYAASSPPQSPVVMSYGRGGYGNTLTTTPKSTRTPRKSTASESRPSLHLGRSPALHNLRSFAASSTNLSPGLEDGGTPLSVGAAEIRAAYQSTESLGRPSIDSAGVARTPKGRGKSLGLRIGSRSRSGPVALAETEQTSLADLAEAEFELGGFDTMGTDLRLALPSARSIPGLPNKPSTASLPPYLRDVDTRPSHDRISSTSTSKQTMIIHPSDSQSTAPSSSTSTRFIQHHLAFHANLSTAETEPRYPSTPEFALALEQASHAECEPGTTADVLRVIVNRPYRSFAFLYENIPFKTHVWYGTDDKMVSEKSVRWLKEKCGSELTIKKGVGHGMLSDSGVVGELFSALGEEARGNWS